MCHWWHETAGKGHSLVAAIEINAHQTGKGEDYYLGQDEETHASFIFAIQLSEADVPKVAESKAGFTVSG